MYKSTMRNFIDNLQKNILLSFRRSLTLLKPEKIIRFYVFIAVMTLNVYSANSYSESDLTISSLSRKFAVTFYNDATCNIHCNSDGSKTTIGYCTTAVIYAKEQIEGLPLKQYNESFYYLCLDAEEKYQGIAESLEEFNQRVFSHLSASSHSSTHNGHTESSLDALCQQIQSSESVCVTFGAGISGGYVPTLIEFFNGLELEKSCSADQVSDGSLIAFIIRLVTEKDKILNIVQTEWGKVFNCDISSTPAHTALKKILELLEDKRINTSVYTDNIDGIHHRVGIQLSEDSTSDGEKIIYPPLDNIRDKKMTVLVCGQSFDFHYVLSTIHARAHLARELVFFHLNLEADCINIYQELDVPLLLESSPEGIDISQIQQETLDMKFIKGSLHDILPALYEKLSV